jgi:TPR repeat protein
VVAVLAFADDRAVPSFADELIGALTVLAQPQINEILRLGIGRPPASDRLPRVVSGRQVPTGGTVATLLLAGQQRKDLAVLARALGTNVLSDGTMRRSRNSLRALVNKALGGDVRSFKKEWLDDLAAACDLPAEAVGTLRTAYDSRPGDLDPDRVERVVRRLLIKYPQPPASQDVSGTATRGKQVGDWDPIRLGVHRAIGGRDLPAYITRDHDDLLHAALDPGSAANRLIVLRGGSSTGKSRTAFEAVRARLPAWLVDYPPSDVATLARLSAGFRPQTVLWLDELRDYAETRAGRNALARIADLLGSEDQVIVVATLWPQFWRLYTERPAGEPGTADTYAAVRRLLLPLPCLADMRAGDIDPSAGGVLDVPEKFGRPDLDRAAVLARENGDPALSEAIAAAAAAGADGEIAQYLAGVPDLLDHYEGPGADPYGHAVVTAAMDASRMGFRGVYSAALLTTAAEGYLTGRQRAAAPPGWRDPALKYASRELRGAVCALEPIPPEQGDGVAGYRLADYLDQHGRRERRARVLPSTLWDALASHRSAAEDRIRLALTAEACGLYRLAARLATGPLESGTPDAMEMIARHWERSGDVEAAVGWYRKSLEIRPGNPVAGLALARLMNRAGSAEDASRLRSESRTAFDGMLTTLVDELRRRAEAGNSEVMITMGRRSREEGRDDEAADWYRRAAEAGEPEGTWELADLLEQRGQADEAAARLRADAETGNPETMMRLIRLLHRRGHYEEASPWIRRCVGSGGDVPTLIRIVSASLAEQSEEGERNSESGYRTAAEAGDPEAMWSLAEYLASTDRLGEAIGWFQRSAEEGLVRVEDLARRLEELGCAEAAETPFRNLAARGEILAMKQLAEFLERAHRNDEAESICRTLLEIGAETTQGLFGNSAGIARLTDFLERTGRTAEGDQVRIFGISPGGSTAEPWIAPRP